MDLSSEQQQAVVDALGPVKLKGGTSGKRKKTEAEKLAE